MIVVGDAFIRSADTHWGTRSVSVVETLAMRSPTGTCSCWGFAADAVVVGVFILSDAGISVPQPSVARLEDF